MKRWWLVLIIPFLFTPVIFRPKPPAFFSPLSSHPKLIDSLTLQPANFVVYGFLPYWTLKSLPDIPLDRLTHLAYFGLNITASGEIDTQELGYRRWVANQETLSHPSLPLHLVIKSPDDATLYAFLHNPTAQTTLISRLQTLLSQSHVSGLNLDFEPQTVTDSATTDRFTAFTQNLRATLPNTQIVIDIYPKAAIPPSFWDLPSLAPYTDYFVVMTYDYYRAASPRSGPVAPLYPAQPEDRHAVIKNLAQITTVVPREKVLMGIPFYGYEWQTQTPTPGSARIGNSGRLATYKRVQALLQSDLTYTLTRNPSTRSPYLWYQVADKHYQIHFDDTQSLQEKVTLARDAGLGGLAIWALGYEGVAPELWSSLASPPP